MASDNGPQKERRFESLPYELELYNDPKSKLYIECTALRSREFPRPVTPQELYQFRWLSHAPESYSLKSFIEQTAVREALAYNESNERPVKAVRVIWPERGDTEVELEERLCQE